MSLIQKSNSLKCVLFDKDPLDCALRLVHQSSVDFNTGKVNVESAVSRIQANLVEWEPIPNGNSKKDSISKNNMSVNTYCGEIAGSCFIPPK